MPKLDNYQDGTEDQNICIKDIDNDLRNIKWIYKNTVLQFCWKFQRRILDVLENKIVMANKKPKYDYNYRKMNL